ncbi:MAG: hypothetical protein RL329_964 [Bacteroidota bacterium]|jgi:hypothetical protein
MARRIKQFEKVLLIVCEGTATEPQYFRWLVENKSNNIWSRVEIRDNTTLPDDISFQKPTELSGGKTRPTRQLKFENPNKRKDNQRNVLEELLIYLYGNVEGIKKYKDVQAVPLRYVALTQCYDELYKGIYDELWAVFDKNGHTHHQEAFELAKKGVNGKKTYIGFSSRSFEEWILLHFEKNQIKFEKTTCALCEDKRNQTSCHGKICLVGYLRTHYLPNYAKSNKNNNLNELMQTLFDKQNIAFENAAWLRTQMQSELKEKEEKIYLLNPYTDLDMLVKKMIGF